jgi:hypothetical protein
MEAVMKKPYAAAFLGLLLLFSIGCSSIPSGTERIDELLKNAASRIGQDVVVVGMADTKTPMSSFKMFKIYQKNNQNIWVLRPEGTEEPPQGVSVRVSGPLQEKEFKVIGKVYYIEATKVRME